MELALNLAWFGLAILMAWLWLNFTSASTTSRRMQFVALGLVILILLPAISMTDDLLAAQNPAETDTCLRRDHDWRAVHAVFSVDIALAVPLFSELSVQTLHRRTPGVLPAQGLIPPALSSIDDRPPPAA